MGDLFDHRLASLRDSEELDVSQHPRVLEFLERVKEAAAEDEEESEEEEEEGEEAMDDGDIIVEQASSVCFALAGRVARCVCQ